MDAMTPAAGGAPAASDPPALPGAERAGPPSAQALFAQGVALLRGAGGKQDFGLAAARLLDASDLNHPYAHLYCALLYFCGEGVSRNVATAQEYASRYLEADARGRFAAEAKGLLDGSLGTAKARKLLLEKPAAAAAQSGAQRRSPVLALAIGIPAVVIAALGAFVLVRTRPASALDSPAGISLESLVPTQEAEQARKEALAQAASLQAGAQVLMQERKAAEDAQARADQERKAAEEEQARQQAAAEKKAEEEAQRQRAEAEAQAAGRQQAQRQGAMLATARDSIRQGELDRANGILDVVLASDPANQDANAMKQYIRQVRARAIHNIQIR